MAENHDKEPLFVRLTITMVCTTMTLIVLGLDTIFSAPTNQRMHRSSVLTPLTSLFSSQKKTTSRVAFKKSPEDWAGPRLVDRPVRRRPSHKAARGFCVALRPRLGRFTRGIALVQGQVLEAPVGVVASPKAAPSFYLDELGVC